MIRRVTTRKLLLLGAMLGAAPVAAQEPAAQEPSAAVEDGAEAGGAPAPAQEGPSETEASAPEQDHASAPEEDEARAPGEDGPTPERSTSASERVIDRPLEEEVRDRSSDNRRHEGTVAVRVGAGVPYLFAIKYGAGSPCESPDPASEPEAFCTRLGEPFLDLELSYSVTDQFELTGYVTLALRDDDAALAKARVFGVGLRGYTSADAVVKGFFGARLVLDLTRSDVPGFDDFDLGLHGGFGIQVEPVRWIGIYLQGGVSIRVLRNFSFLPEVSGGLQFRFP